MKAKSIISLLCVVLLIAGGVYGGYLWGTSQNEDTPPISLVGEINKIEELNVIEYSFTSVDTLKDSLQIGETNIPFTEKEITILVPGTIKYHIDLKKVKKSDIDVNADKTEITVTMPKLEVDTIVDVDNVEYYDKKNNLFNPLQLEDSDKLESRAIKAAQKQAEGEGIIEQGQNNAESIMQKLVRSLPGYEKCVVHCDFN